MTLADVSQINTAITQIGPTVDRLRDTFQSGSTRSRDWRVQQLKQLRRMTLDHQGDIMTALKADLGKDTVEAWTSEIGFVIGDIDHTIKHLKRWMKPRKVSQPLAAMPGKSFLLPEPLGTVLIIGAWNYPFQLVVAPLVAAIAAGNCAVLKPSELSPRTSAVLADLVPRYLDTGAFAVVEGAVPETSELLKQVFDHIMYTGGENVGKIVMRAASEHLTPVTLELGGKSPCVVDSTADIKVAASRIAWSKWMNAGQTCVAPDYVLVERKVADELVEALKTTIQKFYGADPKSSKDYGRIVNHRHFERLKAYLEGQDVIFGGQNDAEERYLSPTLVMEPAADSKVMQEEIFGPILPILVVDDINQAVPFINARPKPLALYVYTKSQAFEDRILGQTSAGSVCVNDGFMFMVNPDLPFGGVGNSGMGAYHGQHGFDTFSHLKSVMKRPFALDVDLRYPPFSKTKFALLKRLL